MSQKITYKVVETRSFKYESLPFVCEMEKNEERDQQGSSKRSVVR